MDGVIISKIEPMPGSTPIKTTFLIGVLPGQVEEMFCIRVKGFTSCHVHGGKDKSKKPETVRVIMGRVRFTFQSIATNNTESCIVDGGTTITIDPLIIHKTEVLEDAVIVEPRVTRFNKDAADTRYPQIV